MAILNLYGFPVSVGDVNVSITANEATHFQLSAGSLKIDFYGVNMVISEFEGPLSGTLTGYSVSLNGIVSFEFLQLNRSLVEAMNYLLSNPTGAREYLLNGNDTINGSSLPETLEGFAGLDLINGGGGDDTLVCWSADADTLAGGTGNDTYVIGMTPQIVVVEQAGEGVDTIQTFGSYTLPANVENLIVAPGFDDVLILTGNELGNDLSMTERFGTVSMLGGAGNDTLHARGYDLLLDGGTGADWMEGFADLRTVYIVDNVGDVVHDPEATWGVVRTTLENYTLATFADELVLEAGVVAGNGNASDNVLRGNALANMLSGGDGNDTFEGGIGPDTLIGGAGDDVYPDDVADTIIENANGGIDTLHASRTLTLQAFIENLVLEGEASLDVTGNNLANRIEGNAGNNVIDGGLGADTMIGGEGDDTYVMRDAGDVVIETSQTSFDSIYSYVDVDLTDSPEVEDVHLVGNGNAAATGSAAHVNFLQGNDGKNRLVAAGNGDTLQGGAGNDTLIGADFETLLDGGAGADSMVGGFGNDIFMVDNTGDVVVELAGSYTNPNDVIFSSVSYVLPERVEELRLTGSGNLTASSSHGGLLVGNLGNNLLTGGDTMQGGEGNDTLVGTAKTQFLYGGSGDDLYVSRSSFAIEEEDGGTDKFVYLGFGRIEIPFAIERLVANYATTVAGSTGNDFLVANRNANVLVSGGGQDTLLGLAGDDQFFGHPTGNTTVDGDAGIDTMHYDSGQSSAYTIVRGAGGTVTVTGPASVDVLTGIERIEFLDKVVVLDANAPTGQVVVSGAVQVGQVLTSSVTGIADADGVGTLSLQWYRDSEPISGATGSSYTLKTTDTDSTISLRVGFIDGAGNAESLWSNIKSFDTVAPKATWPTSSEPVNAGQYDRIDVQFDEGIVRGAGNIVLHSEFGEFDLSIPIANDTLVFINDDTLQFAPAAGLQAGVLYHVQVPAGAVHDAVGNASAAVSFDLVTAPEQVIGTILVEDITAHHHIREYFDTRDGNDIVRGLEFGDAYLGGQDTDTATFAFAKSSVEQTYYGGGNIEYTSGAQSIYLQSVERVAFTDTMLAFDTDFYQAPWVVNSLFVTVLGFSVGPYLLSQWVKFADDHPQMDMADLAQEMLDYYAPTLTTPSLVSLLFTSTLGMAAGPAEVALVSSFVGPNAFFANNGALLAYVAEMPSMVHHADLVAFTNGPVELDASFFL